jgi:hypothetical protein
MKQKKHYWYVNTGMYHKPIKVFTTGMEEARRKAYEKFIKMSYEEFNEYIPFNVHGSRPMC